MDKTWKLFWVGERVEIYIARSVDEAKAYVENNTGTTVDKAGEVSLGAHVSIMDDKGNPSDIQTEVSKMFESGVALPCQLIGAP